MEEEKVIDVDKEIALPIPPATTTTTTTRTPTTRTIRSFLEDKKQSPSRLKLHLALIFAQAGFAGYQVLVRRSLGQGNSILVLCFYKNCLGFVLLRFLASVLERERKPVLNFPALLATFLLGIFGLSVSELCYLQGLKFTTPTFAAAMQNLIPVFTFILALIFRMEKVDIDRAHGIAKLLGSIFIICGWMLLLVYKGDTLLRSNFTFLTRSETLRLGKPRQHSINLGAIHFHLWDEQYGIIFLVISCFSSSVFLILQAFIMEKYVGPISFASFAFFFSIMQVGVAAAVHVHERSKWSRLSVSDGITIAYAGIIAAASFGIQSWGVKQGGPMLVAAYQPLETIATIFLAFFLLRENLSLGSVVGGGIILLGLYLMIWGKEREQCIQAHFVVRDFHGMSSTNTELQSDFSFGVITDNGLASSATKSVAEPLSLEQNVEEAPWYSKIRAPKINGEMKPVQGISGENNASAWIFTQPLFGEDEGSPVAHAEASGADRRSAELSRQFSRNQSVREQSLAVPPLSLEEFQLKLSNDSSAAAGGGGGDENGDDSSEASTEMASTRSNFSRWNSGRTVLSVRSIPSRMSNVSNLSSLGPSRANSVRSAASRLTPGRSTVSEVSSDSEQLHSSRTSSSSD